MPLNLYLLEFTIQVTCITKLDALCIVGIQLHPWTNALAVLLYSRQARILCFYMVNIMQNERRM